MTKFLTFDDLCHCFVTSLYNITMDVTIEKNAPVVNVRLAMKVETHAKTQRVRRLLQVKNNQDLTLINIYLKAIEIGLTQLEKEAA